MRRSIGGTVGSVFVAIFLLATREFSFLAAGLLQDGIEHLHYEALFRARQLAEWTPVTVKLLLPPRQRQDLLSD